jgi:hypothetical protein
MPIGRPKTALILTGEERARLHALETAIHAFLDAHNDAPKPFVWTKSADDILASIGRFAQRTLDTHVRDL